ncbi:hypothetical protein Tsubulata_003015 [Turnera subulata]|uniref:PGG domain-containing protein n=1 Tax=Turnera subulata TaxID=218843 RepID=A0A9Q0G3M7_9ROSI|nr:hypothetical protein Tsubulata_003015 [Turnera subulata]
MGIQFEATIPEDPSKNFYQYYRSESSRWGIWQEKSSNNEAGTAILGSNKTSYNIFLFSNTLAYSSSTAAIFWLLIDCPFQTEILMAVYAMNFTYAASVAAVHPGGAVDWRYMFIAYMLPYFLRVILQFVRRTKEVISQEDV